MRDSKTALARAVKERLNRGTFYLVLLIGISLIPFALAQRTTWRPPANIMTVSNLNDSGSGSLRQALADASDGDTINFAVSGTISLTSGELVIDENITISGPESNSLTVRPSSGSNNAGTLTIIDSTISNNTAWFGHFSGGGGGGILNSYSSRRNLLWVRIACVTGRAPSQQFMGKRWPAVILQWAKQGIGIDLVARAVQKTAAIVTTDIVSLRGNGRVIDIFRATSI